MVGDSYAGLCYCYSYGALAWESSDGGTML